VISIILAGMSSCGSGEASGVDPDDGNRTHGRDRQKLELAKKDLHELAVEIEELSNRLGHYPSSEGTVVSFADVCQEWLKDREVEDLPKVDVWGSLHHYFSIDGDPRAGGHGYALISFGPDGRPNRDYEGWIEEASRESATVDREELEELCDNGDDLIFVNGSLCSGDW
jgi:hypothetical protein